MQKPDVSIVTACDANYFWGAFLLTASLQKMQAPVNLIVFQSGFSTDMERSISQFSIARVRKDESSSPFSLNNRKPGYLLKADSEYVAWFDADCLAVGSTSDLIVPVNRQLQVRLRLAAENASVFERYYRPGDQWGEIPSWILERWKSDVGGRKTPRMNTTCPSNCFVIHNRFLPFIQEWEDLISRVLNPRVRGPIDKSNPAYWMTDESTLNALLLYSEKSPEPSQFRLDDLSGGHVAHFIGSPKPWRGWNRRFLYCIPHIIELLQWVEKQGLNVPPIPSSFKRWRVPYSYAEAHVRGVYRDSRRLAGRRIRTSKVGQKLLQVK